MVFPSTTVRPPHIVGGIGLIVASSLFGNLQQAVVADPTCKSCSCGETVGRSQGIGRERTADDVVGVGIAGNRVFATGIEIAQNVGDDGIHVLRSREVVGVGLELLTSKNGSSTRCVEDLELARVVITAAVGKNRVSVRAAIDSVGAVELDIEVAEFTGQGITLRVAGYIDTNVTVCHSITPFKVRSMGLPLISSGWIIRSGLLHPNNQNIILPALSDAMALGSGEGIRWRYIQRSPCKE